MKRVATCIIAMISVLYLSAPLFSECHAAHDLSTCSPSCTCTCTYGKAAKTDHLAASVSLPAQCRISQEKLIFSTVDIGTQIFRPPNK